MQHVINVRKSTVVIGVFERKGNIRLVMNAKVNLESSRCTPSFECIDENYRYEKNSEINTCTNIERVSPDTISLHASDIQVRKFVLLEVLFNFH